MGGLVSSDSPIADLPRDAAIGIAGPPMTGKYSLMLTMLAHFSEQTIVISTRNAAERVVADFDEVTGGGSHGPVGVVDCVPRAGGPDRPETDLRKYAGSPENMTRIGVKFTELFDRFYEEGSATHTGVGLHSISQLLMHAGLKSTYQFLQVLIGQIRSADWFFVAVVDTNVDEEELQTLYQHFDGIVQTREGDSGRRELRVRGFDPSASTWSEF